MVQSGYHPLKHRPLRIVLGWCTVYHPLKHCPPRIVHSGYHPLKHCPLRIVLGMVHSGYHPLKHRPLRILLGCCTVDIILLSIGLLGKFLDGAQWISSS